MIPLSLSRDVKFPITCSECGREHKISLENVAKEITITCDCGKKIAIKDVDGKGREATKKFDELERLVKQIGGRITLG